MISTERQHRWHVLVAFALLYFFWGSTYLAIRIAVLDIPPLLMAGVRFSIAGPLMLFWCWRSGRRVALKEGEAWRLVFIGVLLLSICNVALVWAEQWLPSGLAALLMTAIPMWFLVLETWVLPGEHHASPRAVGGLGLGVLGIVVLLWPQLSHTTSLARRELFISFCLIGTGFAWALGSVCSKRWQLPVDPLTASAYQMVFAGAVNVALGSAAGEWRHVAWRWHGVSAVLYLVVFGSWVGFSAYVWLLKHVPTAKVSTYAYVNPVVAVFLGWLVLREPITGYIVAGTAIVVVAVFLITGAKLRTRVREAPGAGLRRDEGTYVSS
jgi:drug/metabolite transporter (DMT)-like permease